MVTQNESARSAHSVYGGDLNISDYGFSFNSLTEKKVEQIAEEITKRYGEVIGFTFGDLSLTRVSSNDNFWHSYFEQTVDGTPIFDTKLGLTIDRHGDILKMKVDVYPDGETNAFSPSIQVQQAIAIAVSSTKQVGLAISDSESRTVYFPVGDKDDVYFRIAWEIQAGDYQVVVDGQSGEILSKEYTSNSFGRSDLEALAKENGPDKTSATTNSTEQIDVQSGEAPDRTTYTVSGTITASYWIVYSSGSTTSAELTDGTKVRLLPQPSGTAIDCTGTDSSGEYSCTNISNGTYKVEVESENDWGEVKNTSGNTETFESSSFSVSGANVDKDFAISIDRYISMLHHTTKIHNHFTDTHGYDGLDYQTDMLFVDDTSISGLASYCEAWVKFGKAESTDTWGESTDVIYHEYTHRLVVDAYCGNIRGSDYDREEHAMDEGIPDYFAASLSGNSDLPTGVTTTWSRDISPDSLYSNFNNTYTPPDLRKMRNNSLILSGAIWDVRAEIGTAYADADALAAVEMNSDSFSEFGFDMAIAEKSARSCTNVLDIEDEFADHEIDIVGPIEAGNISGPWSREPLEEGTWSVTTQSGGYTPYSYSWEYYEHCGGSRAPNCDEWHGIGSTTASADFTNTGLDFDIRVTVSSCGDSDTSTTEVTILEAKRGAESTATDMSEAALPTEYSLLPNYPNPFNPTTTIRFDLPQASNMSLRVYDTTGRLVSELFNGSKRAGFHSVEWDASSRPSGVYVLVLKAGEFQESRSMILLK